MYTLYSDKQNIFECDIQLEGASLTDAFARLIIESDNINLMYNGTITSDGTCRIEMPRLKGIVKESGNLRLEVIADDMYFNPWNSDFELKKSKNITVEVKEPKGNIIKENRAKVKVNVNHPTKTVRRIKPKPTIKESTFTKQDLKKLLLKLRSRD